MTAKAWFIVGVRLIGVWALFSALPWLSTLVSMGVEKSLGYPFSSSERPPANYIVHVVGYVAFGLYLIIGAGHLAGLLHASGCQNCGYPIDKSGGSRCPECGASYAHSGAGSPPSSASGTEPGSDPRR